MKKINYILIAFITAVIVLNPINVNAWEELYDYEIPYPIEEIEEKIKILEDYIIENNYTEKFKNYIVFIERDDNIYYFGFDENEITLNSSYISSENVITMQYSTNLDIKKITFEVNIRYLNLFAKTNMKMFYTENLKDTKGNIVYKPGDDFLANVYKGTEEEPPIILPEYTKTFNIFGIPFLMSYDYYLENVVNVHFINLTLSDDSKFIIYIIFNLFLLMFWFNICKVLYTFVIYLKNSVW